MKKAFITRIILLSVSFLLSKNADSQNLDSLFTVWQDQSQPDSNRVNAYKDYIWNAYLFLMPDSAAILAEELHVYAKNQKYIKAAAVGFNIQGIANTVQSNYKLALEYFEKSMAIFEDIGDKQGIASSLNNFGLIYSNQDNYPLAIEYYEKSLAIAEEMGDKRSIINSLMNIGNVYKKESNYPAALQSYQTSLSLMEETGNLKGIANCLNSIGMIYDDQGDYLRALEYYEKSLSTGEEIGDINTIANSLNNIGIVYQSLNNYPRALEYLSKAREVNEELGNKKLLANNLNNIGLIYIDQGNYPLALEYSEMALALREEIQDKNGISACLNNIGIIYQKQDKSKLALDYCEKGLELAKEIGALDWQKNASQCLYDTYKAMGNNSKALEYYEKMIVLRDSIYNEENTRKLTRIEMQYEFNQKEAAAQAEQEKKDAIATQELERQKMTRNGFIAGFTVMLLFAGVFLGQRNKIGKEKKRSEELLLNILPAEVAEELKAKGEAEAKLIDDATVLFTDFKGFTGMSETMTPKELVADLNHCFSAFDRIMQKYGIEKIKTIGDAYMAAGGLPTPNATHAKDVVMAALEIRDFIENGKVEKIAQNLPYFEIRIGVHTGPVVAGIVGVKKFQYDIWGDTVNTASRMESNGEVGKVNISQATFELLKDDPDFAFESRGKIEAKGKGEMEMYFVSGKTETV